LIIHFGTRPFKVSSFTYPKIVGDNGDVCDERLRIVER